MIRLAVVVLVLLALAGCPIRVDPPTSAVCPARPNCGRCAATAPCAGWCPSSDPARRGCIATDPTACDVELVRVVEACPEDETGSL